MKPFRTTARRIARRLVHKMTKPAALWIIDRKLHNSQARSPGFIIARGITVSLARYERQRQVELIARRNQIREW